MIDCRLSRPREGICMRTKIKVCIAVGVVVATMGAFAGLASAAGNKGKGYDPLPALPGNVPSLGYEATATREFGDSVSLANPARKHFRKVNVVLSSWACKAGSGVTCVTTPGDVFKHPITLSIYASDNAGNPGVLILRKTTIFKIKYRPSADAVNCTGPDAGKWFDGSECNNGLAQIVTFKKLGDAMIPADRNITWTIRFNTTHYGANPIGEGASCFGTPEGCGYDSLNVGAESFPAAPFNGTDLDDDGAVWNTSYGPFYCDGGAGGSGTLRVDTGPDCWTDYRPLAEIFVRA